MVTPAYEADFDVVIVGAGAAGVAAGHALRDSGLRVVLLEARGRVGGRAWTVPSPEGVPLDLGCEWLHSADINPVVAQAETLGLTIDRRQADWSSHVGVGFPAAMRTEFQASASRFWDAAERAARDGSPDRPAASVLEPGDRWNPLIQAISTFYNGVELDTVSLIDLDRYVDTGTNWRITEGYGTFVQRAAEGLDVRLGCAVRRIDHSGQVIVLDTARGTLTARSVVVTLPSDVLAGGALAFRPALPEKIAAAASLPLGIADKLFFAVAPDADLPRGHLYGATDRAEMISFDLRKRGNLVEGFVGGHFARSLEDGGPRAFEAEARAQLTTMLGRDLGKDLTFLRATCWARDPFALGSYSHAIPGCADQRPVLAAPVDGRLFFAGEACSTTFFSTAHGAWLTGIETAARIREHVPRPGVAEPSPKAARYLNV